MSDPESVASARYHYQWKPDRFQLEGSTNQYDLDFLEVLELGILANLVTGVFVIAVPWFAP